MADANVDRVDLGSADANGDLVIMASNDDEVATLACSDPAFGDGGASVAGRADANAFSDDTNATGGTAALFKFQDKDNAEVFRGTVTGDGGGGDIELDNATVGAGVTVSMDNFTYSASA
jgi:hypothetical protein